MFCLVFLRENISKRLGRDAPIKRRIFLPQPTKKEKRKLQQRKKARNIFPRPKLIRY